MAPTDKETADLIRRIRDIGKIPPQAIAPYGGGPVTDVWRKQNLPDITETQKRTEEGLDLAGQVAQGGINFIGGAFRALTGLGRGVTNAVAGALPHINNIWDIYKDGFQIEDLGKTATEFPQIGAQGLWGFVKGVAVSGVPAARDLISTFDKRPIYELGTELLTSKEFNRSMRNLQESPGGSGALTKGLLDDLASLNDPKSAEQIVVPGIDVFGVKVLQMNKAELYGLGWDIFVDPTTYATMGIAGAAKGLGRGTSTVVKYQKAGKPANFAETMPKAMPRPFYTEGGKKAKQVAYKQPTYTVMNTSPIAYILKEAGRGFTEAHMLRLNRIASRSSALAAVRSFQEDFDKALVENIFDNPQATTQYVEQIASSLRDDVVSRQRQSLVEQGISDPMEMERIIATTTQAIQAQIDELTKQAPQFISVLSTREAADNIRQMAEAQGITPLEAGLLEVADIAARNIPKTVDAIKPTRGSRIDQEQSTLFARSLESASDPKSVDSNFGTAWDAFKQGADTKTLELVWESLTRNIGYREAAARAQKQAAADAMTETKEYAAFVNGLQLRPITKKNRKVEADMKLVVEPITGTKLARLKAVYRETGEYKQISKMVRMAKDTRQGAGSKLTAGKKTAVATRDDIINAPKNFVARLSKIYYEEIVRPKLPNAVAWEDLIPADKIAYTEQVLINPTVFTADMFNRAFGDSTVMAARVAYLVERETVSESKTYSTIKRFLDNGYNPLTVKMRHPKLYTLTFDGTTPLSMQNVLRLMSVAAGQIQDPLVNRILNRLGINRATLQTPDGFLDKTKLEEILFDAHTAIMARERANYLEKVRLQNPGLYSAQNLVDPTQLNAEAEAIVGQYIKDLQLKGRIATVEEIEEAIVKLADLQTAQKEARETLATMGFEIFGMGAPAFKTLTTVQSIRAGKASSTEAKTFKEIEAIIAKPRDKEARGTSIEVFQRIIPQLEEIAARPNTSQMIKEAISEILDGKVNLRGALKAPAQGETYNAFFSLMGNIIKRTKDRVLTGTVVGFDTVFTRSAGQYDQQAITAFLEFAYKASKSQDSLDGGYFAIQLERLAAAKNFKPLSEQTSEELRKTLQSITWNGEGISAGLLKTIINFTQRTRTKVKPRNLDPKEIADMDRAEQALYDDLIAGFVDQERAQIRVAQLEDQAVVADAPIGYRGKTILYDELSGEEKYIYDEIRISVAKSGVLIDDYNTVQNELRRVREAIDSIKRIVTVMSPEDKKALSPELQVWREGQGDVAITKVSELQPGDRLSSAPFKNLMTWAMKTIQTNPKLPPELRKAVNELKIASSAIHFRGETVFQRAAAAAIEKSRATLLAAERFPAFAQRVNMAVPASKIADPIQAGVNWRARAWLGKLVIAGDKAIRDAELADPLIGKLAQRDAKNVMAIQKEKEALQKIINGLKQRYKLAGVKPTKADVESMRVGDIIESANALDLLRKIETMKVTTLEEQEDWAMAMQELLKLQIPIKSSAYKDFADLVKQYKNPKKAEGPVPTDREMLEVLSQIEGPAGERAKQLLAEPKKIRRTTIMTIIGRLTGELDKAELAAAKDSDFMARINAAGADEITSIQETLPEPKVLQQTMLDLITQERVKLYDEGLGGLESIVADSLGAMYKQFILKRVQTHTEAETDALGRLFSADSARGTYPRKAMKYTFEKQTLYTGWKKITKDLRKIAELKGYDVGSPEYMQFMTTAAMRIMRLRDMHLHTMGIFPANTPSIKAGENKILEMGVYTPEEVKGLSKPVFLSDADILDIFDPHVIGKMLFIGPVNSIPITSFAPAAGLLVTAMDTLKPGQWFTKAEEEFLRKKMAKLMENDIRKVSKVSKKSNISHWDLAPEAFKDLVDTVVGLMVRQESATKLWQTHITNAAYAGHIYKYESGQVTEPILTSLIKMFEDPRAAVGNKIDAMIKASEDIRALTGREDLSPEVVFQAELDLNVVLNAYLDRDSMTIAREVLRMEEAMKSAEGRAILASQKKAAEGENYLIQRMNQIRVQTDKERGELYVSLAHQRNMHELNKPPEVGPDDPFDVYLDHGTAKVQIKQTLRFGNAFGRLFYNYGMENLRPLYGAVERRRVNDTSLFEHIGGNMKAKWTRLSPDRNILAEAWQIIQRVPDDILDKSIAARASLREAARVTAATGKKPLSPEQYDDLMRDSNLLNEFLSLDDDLLNQAIDELWSFGGRIFGGGEKSMIRQQGISAKWMNRNLREVGGAITRSAIDENGMYQKLTDAPGFTSTKSMGDIWREWEIVNPVEMIVTMNAALQRAQLIPTIADDAVRLFGVPKSQFKSPAEAKAAGFVAVKPVENYDARKELVYFMDTENYYYPIQIAQELRTFSDFLSSSKGALRKQGTLEKAILKYAQFTNFTKSMMTILRPGNYVQNANGSIWANGFAGVLSPMAYYRAVKAMQSAGRKVNDLDMSELEKQMARYEAIKGAEGFTIKSVNDPRKTDGMMVTIKGKAYKFSFSDLEKLSNKYGVRVPIAQNRDADLVGEFAAASTITDLKTIAQKIAKKYNTVAYWAGKVHANRDEFFRMTLFLDYLSKYNWTSLEQGAREAMKVVNKYHPQVQDLAEPLQKTRQFLLFQTWKTKMMGTVLTDILDKPGPMINSIRVIQASNNSAMQSYSSTPFNLSPEGVILPERYQFNLDPLGVDSETGLLTRYSLANPVSDLYGSAGLLSTINFNNYEPLPDQVLDIGFDFVKAYFAQGYPYVIDALINYPQQKTTSGQDFGKGGFTLAQDAPVLLKDFMVQTGLNPLHAMLVQLFPALAVGKMKPMSPQAQDQETLRIVGNFLTGLKVDQIDSQKNRETGMQELLTKLEQLRGMR